MFERHAANGSNVSGVGDRTRTDVRSNTCARACGSDGRPARRRERAMAGWSRPSMVPMPEGGRGRPGRFRACGAVRQGVGRAGRPGGRRARSATDPPRPRCSGDRPARRAAGPRAGERGPGRDLPGVHPAAGCTRRAGAPAGRPGASRGGPAARPAGDPAQARRCAGRRGAGGTAAVVALGLLASAARSASVPERSVSVQVAPGESLWQIARRTAPNADVDAVVERIVAQNGLASAAWPGQGSRPSGAAAAGCLGDAQPAELRFSTALAARAR